MCIIAIVSLFSDEVQTSLSLSSLNKMQRESKHWSIFVVHMFLFGSIFDIRLKCII